MNHHGTHTMTRFTTAIAATLLTSAAMAQDLDPAAPAQQNPIFLVGATVHTVSGDTIENGVVSFSEGTIGLVGHAEDIMPRVTLGPDTKIIDLTGHHIYPGLIDSVTVLGLEEVSAVRATLDKNEVGNMTPEVRAYVAVNPDSTVIPTARTNGVLSFGVFPTGGRIPGRASILVADGWTTEDLALERDAGVIISFDPEKTDELDLIFDQTVAYAQHHDRTDQKLEALTTVLPGDEQNPVFLLADSFDAITGAIRWAQSRDLDPIIVGGRDAHLCTELLVETGTPVIVGGAFDFPKRSDSPYDEPYTLAAKLDRAGVDWALTMSGRFGHERNLPDAAAICVAHGLDHAAALEGITLAAARILGVDDRIGSIEQGKHATLIVTDGDILDVRTTLHSAYIQGRTIDLDNKQTDLRDTYMEKYRQLGLVEDDDNDESNGSDD
jgi:imidazolonepropionase-like amidohydrolase